MAPRDSTTFFHAVHVPGPTFFRLVSFPPGVATVAKGSRNVTAHFYQATSSCHKICHILYSLDHLLYISRTSDSIQANYHCLPINMPRPIFTDYLDLFSAFFRGGGVSLSFSGGFTPHRKVVWFAWPHSLYVRSCGNGSGWLSVNNIMLIFEDAISNVSCAPNTCT